MFRLRPARPARSFLQALLGALLLSSPSPAEQALVAVAANFTVVAEQLVEDFEALEDHRITLTSGSTGKLYAQVRHGAPYDIFLAADRERPQKLVDEGLVASEERRFTYARGRLVVWGPALAAMGDALDRWSEELESPQLRRLALANPELAPYGAAAREALEARSLWEGLQSRLVFGENVGQAFSMVVSGNAQLGLVARSSVITFGGAEAWLVPETLHAPIRQDAVLLRRAEDNAAARAFFDFLRSPTAKRRLLEAGYDLP